MLVCRRARHRGTFAESDTPRRSVVGCWSILIAGSALTLLACSDPEPRSDNAATLPASPLSERVGFDPLTDVWDKQRFAEELAACMKARGFEFVAYVPKAADRADIVSVEGYGVAAGYLDLPPVAPRPIDPNVRIASALKPTDRQAYDLAFLGRPEQFVGEELPFGDLGCNRQTQLQVYGFEGRIDGPLERAIDQIESRANAATGYLDAKTLWSSCMKALGYDFEGPDEPQQFAITEIEKITGSQGGGVAVSASVDQVEVRRALEREIELAERDLECRKKSEIDEVFSAEIFLAEAKFLEENPGFVEEFASSLERRD